MLIGVEWNFLSYLAGIHIPCMGIFFPHEPPVSMTTKHQQAQMDTDNGFPLCKNTMVEIYEDMHK